MGIHNFHKWIKKNFSDCCDQINQKVSTEHLYIDINFCLHNVAYNTTNPSTLMKKVCTFIENMLNIIEPQKSITFAMDGPAPYAKLILQRIRRQNMARNIDNEIKTNEINPLCFTPGTKFMLEFNTKLKDFLSNLKEKFKVNIIELFNGPDEAELKIIRQLLINNIKYPLDKHIILSNDADVCVMSTTLCCYEKISIAIKSKKNIDLFNIKKFVEILNVPHIKNYNKNYDLAFILLFMGNDYLPKLLYISFDNIIKSYKLTLIKNRYGLTNNDFSVNINFLKDLMMSLTLNFKNQGWIKSFNMLEYNDSQYKNYLQGILWCLDCYRTGYCNKYDYMYQYKESPHTLGIFNYLVFNDKIEIPVLNPNPIPDYIYALLVLPKKAKNLIDKKYHTFMDKGLKFLYEEEECQICSELHGKLSDLHKTIKYVMTINENFDSLKRESINLSKKLAKHRVIHKNINLKDINFVINLLKK